MLCRAKSIIKARCSNSCTFRNTDKHRLLVDLRRAVLSSTPATFALLRDIKRKSSTNGSWYEDRFVCPCVPHCVSVIDICQARRYLRKSTTTKGHIYLRAPNSEDTEDAVAYQCRAVVVQSRAQSVSGSAVSFVLAARSTRQGSFCNDTSVGRGSCVIYTTCCNYGMAAEICPQDEICPQR